MLHHHSYTIDLGSGTAYKRGKYSVSVGNDGSISVRPGDWLTEYSAAIYGNFWTIDVFRRRDASGNYIRITHPARIFAGEILYHMPTVMNASNGNYDGAVITAASISDIEKTRIAVDQFKAVHPEWSEYAGWVGTGGHAVTDVVEALEVFEFLPEVVGEVASPVGWVLFPIHATLDLIDSGNVTYHGIGLRAAAYGETAWSFDDPVPPPPHWVGSTVTPQYDAAQGRKSWIEGRDNAMKNLDKMVEREKIRKEACQVAFQAIGKNDRNTFVGKVMTEIAASSCLSDGMGHSYAERQMFWQPRPSYPSS